MAAAVDAYIEAYDLPRLYSPGEPPPSLLLGRCLDGRFTILAPLGRGAMGTVYRAMQHPIDREVAVKVLDPQLAVDNPHLVKRFLREARLAGRIAHPNVMAVLDMGQTADGILYLVAELLHGRTLAEAFSDDGAFPVNRVVRIALQLSAALAAAHQHSIIHRDLKPANIMLLGNAAGDDPVRVLDFGVAKSLAALRRGTAITEVNSLVGTPAYMAPEIVTGRAADARADLYSLGVILYQLLAGALPFRAATTTDMLAAHVLEAPPPLYGCPAPLERLVMELLAKDPAQRPPSALHVHAALSEMSGPGTITWPWQRRASSR
jgi:serine/threonine-protein kinase